MCKINTRWVKKLNIKSKTKIITKKQIIINRKQK